MKALLQIFGVLLLWCFALALIYVVFFPLFRSPHHTASNVSHYADINSEQQKIRQENVSKICAVLSSAKAGDIVVMPWNTRYSFAIVYTEPMKTVHEYDFVKVKWPGTSHLGDICPNSLPNGTVLISQDDKEQYKEWSAKLVLSLVK